jgi:hypothetical protein
MITTLGKRGPTPAPTAIRRLHRARPDRINNAEPVPMSWASSAAVVAVARRASHLGRAGPGSAAARVLTPWDAETFSACCDAAARRAVEHLEVEGEVVEQAVMVIVCTPRSPRPAGRLPAGAGGESPDAPRHCETRRSTRTNYAATKQTNETKATMSPLPHNAIRYCPTAVP